MAIKLDSQISYFLENKKLVSLSFKVAKFEQAAKKHKVIAAKRKVDGVYVPPNIDGTIDLIFLGKKKTTNEADVHTEIQHELVPKA